MSQESRTSKSLKNAQVALIYYFLQLILGFFSRKAFFDYLGGEVLGLNTTASNLLGFLNLAELGVSASIGYFLYQPLFDKDYEKLIKLVSLQGWIYRRIAILILFASLILMLFFPLIFDKSPLPLWYAYLTFGVLLFSALLSYFANYRQILLYADQKGYKIQEYVQGTGIIKTILQILAITFLPFPFFSWLILEFLGAIATTVVLNWILRTTYPWLKTKVREGKKYLNEYPEVLKKTKQVFFHRIGFIILGQSSPLIIYGFTSLTTVALFGNYQLIIGKISTLLGSVFSSTGAAVGNLVASNDKERIIKVFWELYDSRLWISLVALISLYHLTNPFIVVWLGEGYCLSQSFLLLFVILNSISLTRTTVDSYISAYGMFNDIWAPLLESVINVILSIGLGVLWGLNGIIIGITISQIVIISIWKPYFLFKSGFKICVKKYFIPVFYRHIVSILLFIISHYVAKPFLLEEIEDVQSLIVAGLCVAVVSFFISGVIFYICFSGTRNFAARFVRILLSK